MATKSMNLMSYGSVPTIRQKQNPSTKEVNGHVILFFFNPDIKHWDFMDVTVDEIVA